MPNSASTAAAVLSVVFHLARLRELGIIWREVPATVPPQDQATSRLSRYVLANHYLRFYFRFIWPRQSMLAQRLHDALWAEISEQLRAFIGQTAFEELCQAWVLAQAHQGQLPFMPERVGAHWGKGVQVDVAAINWRQRQVLLGECKWGTRPVGRDVVVELLEKKSPIVRRVLPDEGEGWQIHYAFFARQGFTQAALAASTDGRPGPVGYGVGGIREEAVRPCLVLRVKKGPPPCRVFGAKTPLSRPYAPNMYGE